MAETTNQPAKTATIEMYAPSSYNDTVTGETLSSVSEKSESYSNEGNSQPEYIVSIYIPFSSIYTSIPNYFLVLLFCKNSFLSRGGSVHEYAISEWAQK